MARRETLVEGQTPDFVASAAGLMRENLGAALTIADLADHVGYSRFHFSRLFSGATGLPPMEYLAALRFAEAKRLLLTSDEPVVDVCAEVGFSSLSTFTRRFRDAVGTAPAELRRLAESVAERPVVPFEVGDPRQPSLQVRLDFGTNADSRLRMPRQTWIGWYARPVPVGLPAAGVLLSGDGPVSLPLSIGNPWLLAVSMHADADPVDQLAPSRPLVAGYQVPLTLTPHKHELPPGITLRFTPADMHGVPLLSALASLRG